jgi:hypothetical protein
MLLSTVKVKHQRSVKKDVCMFRPLRACAGDASRRPNEDVFDTLAELDRPRSFPHAAPFVLLAAAARAGIVATGLTDGRFSVCRAHDLHEFFRRLAGVRQLGELSEIGFAMHEELF